MYSKGCERVVFVMVPSGPGWGLVVVLFGFKEGELERDKGWFEEVQKRRL